MTEPTRGSGVAGALTQLTDQTAVLVRREIDAARAEVVQKLVANAPAAGLLAGSGVLGVLSVASAHRWVLRVLERRLSPGAAALLAAAAYGTGAGIAGTTALGWLRAAPAPLPTETARHASATVGDVAAEVRSTTEG